MAGTVNLFGSQVKKGYVIAGGLVVAAAVFYGWRKNKQQSASNTSASSVPSAASSASSGDQYPADGSSGNPSDPNSTDPATGQTYGDEGQFSGGYGTPGGAYAGSYGYGGYYAGTAASQTAYTTNGQWAQAAEDYLTTTVGADATTVAAALGKYITGQALTADQVSVVEEAIAFGGYPPVNGTDGYPPSIRTSAAPGSGSVTVPSVTGDTAGDAHNKIADAGLVPQADPSQKPSDRVTSTSPKGGSSAAAGTRVLITAAPSGSTGGGTVTVPHTAGQTAGQAHNAIRAAGLVPRATASQKPSMRVISTAPAGGQRVARGTHVVINAR
jgi:hypothetical protein